MKCKIDNVDIKCIATCLPEGVLEMTSLKERFGDKTVETTIKGSGIERLHVAAEHETTADLCAKAAESLFEATGVDKQSIDGVVFVSQTMDFFNPATSCVLQGRLGLSGECVCFDVSYGCSGYIYGLFQAASLIGSGACSNVLVLAGDTNSKVVNKESAASLMVFGDAGSATLVSKGEGTMGFHIATDGVNYRTVLNDRMGFRKFPENTKPGYKPDPAMSGDDVFSFIVNVGPKTIKTVLDMMGWDKDEVDFYGLHQATKITVDFMRKKLKLAYPERAPFDIQNYGNTGPTTVPMVLTDWPHRAEGVDTGTWHKVVMAAYGVGLSWGSVACDLSKTLILRPINQ